MYLHISFWSTKFARANHQYFFFQCVLWHLVFSSILIINQALLAGYTVTKYAKCEYAEQEGFFYLCKDLKQ